MDTPGHVDFSYEVSRSLAACQGAILLIDAVQGIQAQTVANFWMAFSQGLTVIPVINKIDLGHADIERVESQIESQLGLPKSSIVKISAKTGLHVDHLLNVIVHSLPAPRGSPIDSPRALLFDSFYDDYRGVVCYMAVVDGMFHVGDRIKSAATGKEYEIHALGIMALEEKPTESLYTGQIGYMILGMKACHEAFLGDTFFLPKKPVEALPGMKKAKPMVSAGFFPLSNPEYGQLKDAIEKLTLNDRSVQIADEQSACLGRGWRLGFLGTLHMDIFRERLEKEYSANVIITAPTVTYEIVFRGDPLQKVKLVSSMEHFPSASEGCSVLEIREPLVLVSIFCPSDYLSPILALCMERRGVQTDLSYADSNRISVKFRMPLSEIAVNFHNELKSLTSGYAR